MEILELGKNKEKEVLLLTTNNQSLTNDLLMAECEQKKLSEQIIQLKNTVKKSEDLTKEQKTDYEAEIKYLEEQNNHS